VRPAFDAHTFGSQIVVIDTESASQSERWVYAGDTAYSHQNVRGIDNDGVYVAVGLATGSTVNMLMAMDDMVTLAYHNTDRIIVAHDPASWMMYPSRETTDGLHVAELSVARAWSRAWRGYLERAEDDRGISAFSVHRSVRRSACHLGNRAPGAPSGQSSITTRNYGGLNDSRRCNRRLRCEQYAASLWRR
jgi:hypothetical protein